MATTANRGQAPGIDIGISKADRKQIAEGLSRLLADSYTLYLKTHNFHWNVTGPMFNTLHLMFEAQYTEALATAVDLIAERIRALGFPAPGSYKDYAQLSSIKEAEGVPSANQMVAQLVRGQEAVAKTARSIFPAVERADGRADRGPVDAADAGAREDRLDVALPAREVAWRDRSWKRAAPASYEYPPSSRGRSALGKTYREKR